MSAIAEARQPHAAQLVDPVGHTVAYVMSRFPKLTETFVLYEILALQELGVAVELYPLLREREPVMHPEAEPLVAKAHYQPFLSRPIVLSQLHFLATRPRAYLGALWTVASSTFGSLNYFVGGLAVFPKVAHAARLMEEAGVTHVHCHFANHPAVAGLVIHRLTGIPYTFTAHGSDLHRDTHMLREKVVEAEQVVTVSDYNRRLILDECGEEFAERIVVVHCGVDPDVFRPRERLPGGPFRVVCVASLEEVKGHLYLLEACRALADSGIDLDCRLVGDGPFRGKLERRIGDLAIEHVVHLEGRRTRPEVARILAEADVAVCPSVQTRNGDREGIPVALMEAMASGVAVVASDLSGIPELVEHERTGLLVPAGAPAAIAGAIKRLHDDPVLRRRLAGAGRAKVLAEFDIRANSVQLARYLVASDAA